jgi:hypothetical protein
MKLKDRRGLEVSSRNPDSVERFEQALDLTTSYFLDPLARSTTRWGRIRSSRWATACARRLG